MLRKILEYAIWTYTVCKPTIFPVLQLEDLKDKKSYIYPVQRWISVGKHYYLNQYDAFLPQDDKQLQERKVELARKRMLYEYRPSIREGPKLVRIFQTKFDPTVSKVIFYFPQIKELPEDENYSFHYVVSLWSIVICNEYCSQKCFSVFGTQNVLITECQYRNLTV